MGVNDLAGEWRSAPTGPGDEDHQGGLDTAATSLEMAAEECWHPVSEPPREEDGDSRGYVLYVNREFGDPAIWSAGVRAATGYMGIDIYWARIRDVVLLPPE